MRYLLLFLFGFLSLASAQAAPVALPSYAAPTSVEGQEAFNRSAMTMLMAGRDGTPYDLTELSASKLALFFEIKECAWSQLQKMNPAREGVISNWGYFCRFTVTNENSLPFDTIGFFLHDGYEWRYFGRIKPSPADEMTVLSDFDKLQQQPYAKSPFYSSAHTDYQFRGGYAIDSDPYNTGQSFYYKDAYDAEADAGETEKNLYERLNNPALGAFDDALDHPKGTENSGF